eukprot:scaffold4909_cov139-Skeletonema_marinoi.AAC.4
MAARRVIDIRQCVGKWNRPIDEEREECNLHKEEGCQKDREDFFSSLLIPTYRNGLGRGYKGSGERRKRCRGEGNGALQGNRGCCCG